MGSKLGSHRTLVINGRTVRAAPGDTLVDAAIGGRIVIPHDCCTGQCSTCQVRVYAGMVDDQGTREGDTVLACQACVSEDAVIEFDEVPPLTKRAGLVTAIARLSPNIVEVVVALSRRLPHLPGQYVSVAFAGFPARDYSPTLRVDGSAELNELVLHIRETAAGAVSSELGRRIRVGHRVRVRGPFGHAFFRKGEGRLVLVSTGTGWAPIWAIARAARYLEPEREMIVVAGAREAGDLYMRACRDWLRQTGVVRLVLSSTRAAGRDVQPGRVTRHLPQLTRSDTVFAAGAPEMVSAVEFLAATAGARCFADPFLPSSRGRPLHRSILDLLGPLPVRGHRGAGRSGRRDAVRGCRPGR